MNDICKGLYKKPHLKDYATIKELGPGIMPGQSFNGEWDQQACSAITCLTVDSALMSVTACGCVSSSLVLGPAMPEALKPSEQLINKGEG